MAFLTTRAFQDGPRPDPIYALVTGLYACALLIPLGSIVLAGFLTDAVLFTLVVVTATTVVITVVSVAVVYIPGLAIEIGYSGLSWTLCVVPMVVFILPIVGAIAGIVPGSFDSVIGWSLLGIVAGGFFGGLVVAMSWTRCANAQLSDAIDLTEGEAWLPRRHRRIVDAIGIVGGVGLTLGEIAEGLFGYEGSYLLGQVILVVAVTVHISCPHGRTYRVSDAGLAAERGFVRRFRPWSTFTGYTHAEDALYLHTAQWWRPTIRCDTDEIDEIDRVTDALSTHLPVLDR
ncbi:hypothetical protein [Halocatena pleomorpha]|uniref:Uncharacterized protein n=1 Tax=Halocatena pleomorpha TaxID=1785090 RepID=A0A3P3RK32_9EURY|nr:hypothetical protein [Halocatena pleomorpha]RRJ33694.1 hypothetical protein EIK79_02560 [Halocatena pleomorpha]